MPSDEWQRGAIFHLLVVLLSPTHILLCSIGASAPSKSHTLPGQIQGFFGVVSL